MEYTVLEYTVLENTVIVIDLVWSVYSISGCPHCIAMKSKLNELNLTFTEIELDLYETSIRDQVKQMTGSSTGN